ncbi:hypothetical protein VTO73DRAFT_14060 [Trametes versicolor]
MDSMQSHPWTHLTRDPRKTFTDSAAVNGGYDEELNRLSSRRTPFIPLNLLQLPSTSAHSRPLSPLMPSSVWQNALAAAGRKEATRSSLEVWPHVQDFCDPDASWSRMEYNHHGTAPWSSSRANLWPQQPVKHVQFATDLEQIIHTRGLRDERDPVLPVSRSRRAVATDPIPSAERQYATPWSFVPRLPSPWFPVQQLEPGHYTVRLPSLELPDPYAVCTPMGQYSPASTNHSSGALRDDNDEVVFPTCTRGARVPTPIGCRPRTLATVEPTPPRRDANSIQSSVSHMPTKRGVKLDNQSTTISHRGITLTLTAKIADGGVGRVVAAEHDGKSYAVKAVHKWRAFKTLYYTRAMFVRERDVMVRVSASKKTQYLAQLLMAWEEPEVMYLVMPRYPANMRSVLDEEHIRLQDRLLYCAELVAALQALWKLGIVHQDIKPQNILIDQNGRAVLSDFGLAELVSEGQYHTWRDYDECGTPAYMAPEIVASDHASRGHGAEVDVWSLGIVFLEILGLTDRWYFLVPNCEAARKLHERALPIRLDIPPNAGEIPTELLPRMLKTDPAERIPVSGLHAHVPPRMWDEVITGTQSHNWRPDSPCVSQTPPGQYLDFATFQANEGHFKRLKLPTDADADMRCQFKEEQRQAKISDFEYLAPGAFTCS